MRTDDTDHHVSNGRPTRLPGEPVDNHTEVMISRSLRLPADVFEELTEIAAANGTAWSTLIRRWVIEGIAAARKEAGVDVDPAIDLQRGVELINRAAARLRQRDRDAA
jgi:hypothetical protein